MTAKTEAIGAEVDKVKISANPDNLITKIYFPCILTKKMNTHALSFCPLIRKLQVYFVYNKCHYLVACSPF